ncbi:hypothetical protein [Bacillus sp. FJAT-47783]|uniref:hypothetical protein n=1 Tax=Bacillus sp. FJAT-47783 TaxID=2922712 RepID=UPI001FABA66E|nr:hypothetical protein [Bacillus sp. FJAT-47783]
MDYVHLLESYRKLWSNRTLRVEESAEKTLIKAIQMEMLDEMTHPRLRKKPEHKFISALDRILQADLSESEKLQLIQVHKNVIEPLLKK